MIDEHLRNGKLKVTIKPNAKENKILGFDEEKNSLKISIKEPADKDKANKELIKFMTKRFKKNFLIKSGSKSKEKTLIVSD
ncbi:MAG: DUF167 domain-containing protein [Nanobdellota archaeon]